MTLLELYLVFFKFGLLCFGGGYMLVPLLAAGLVGDGPHDPLTPEAFANLVSIAQVTPGPIGINTATYVGYTQQGVPGAILGTIGMVTPALFLVILAIKLLKRYETSIPVRGFLAGMRPASFGLILSAAVIFAELSIFPGPIPWQEFPRMLTGAAGMPAGFGINWGCVVITAATIPILLKTRINFLWLLLASALLGILFCRP